MAAGQGHRAGHGADHPDGAESAGELPGLDVGGGGVRYGIALAWIGVRIAGRVAEQKLPDLYQIAVRSKL